MGTKETDGSVTRRNLLITSLKIPAVYGLLRFLPGCESDPKPPGPVTLVFREDEDFYRQLTEGINQGRSVTITFDGQQKVGRGSDFLAFLKKAENAADILRDMREQDTEQGRRELARAFEKDLLQHETAREPVVVNDQTVVEPATVVLVAIIIIGAITATYAVADVSKEFKGTVEMSGGPVHVKFTPTE